MMPSARRIARERTSRRQPKSRRRIFHEPREPDTSSFRPSHFPERRTFSWWLPQILDDEDSKRRVWLSRRSRALVLQVTLIFTIFVTNLALTVFAVSRYDSRNGVGVIYEGDSGTVQRLDQWIHLLSNLLSTGMLSASNYYMQLQAAPTRKNLDEAHTRGKWLDIRVPSIKNLWYISNWRRSGWFLLAFSSVPIHLLYNSAIFQSLSSDDDTIAVVKDSFLNNAS
ncbi:hypothetical protein B0H63DRAFT_241722 [Podospora didyma]|uniref:DUF6536 domain-containing protein n=1 Tax=Podospora didyma TaxID=330526 RepID=A0AAE0NBU1_9PEZI|nr:hypothetical protein B0H63DRAFT_241722 [Podospora didyma]